MACDSKVMNGQKSIVKKIKLKLKDLLEDIDQLADQEGSDQAPVVQYLTEMVEENKCLSRKCRELAHLVKNLRQEKKNNCKHPRQAYDGASSQPEALARSEQEKLELRSQLEIVRAELEESQTQVQLLIAQLATYKEDFELERRDRERAVEKINLLENRLIEVNPTQTVMRQSHSSLHRSGISSCENLRRGFDRTWHPAGECSDCDALRDRHLILVPRSGREWKEAELSSDLEIDFSKSWTACPAFEGEVRLSGETWISEETRPEDKCTGNKNKRKLDHRDSFDAVSGQKLLSLQ